MAVFGCIRCAYMYEFVVSSAYQRRILLRTDHCPKCDALRTFRFMSHSGAVSADRRAPQLTPLPSEATMWWRKQRTGRTASEPLDSICKANQW